MYRAIGPVCVFGPNNFPLAFNSVSGGDFAAAVAAGNPVIAKANTSHPGTTRLLAEEALEAARSTGMPKAMVQMIYRTSHEDGARLVAHHLVGATGYTGSRRAGLALKRAADASGRPIYLELSSINPVVILPGALEERGEEIVKEYVGSVLMGTGQFCTNPGLTISLSGESSRHFIEAAGRGFDEAAAGTLLGPGVEASLRTAIGTLVSAGAERVNTSGSVGAGCSVPNTLLRVSGERFLIAPEMLQEEAFGNVGVIVVAEDSVQLKKILNELEGNLTACVYSHSAGKDDALYEEVEPILRSKSGRLLNDRMPTGVLVSPAMNHGGPYPATGHPGFTAVGIPASLFRFAALQSYDNVRHDRLPAELRDANPTGRTWRSIDGAWTVGSAGG
jgi:alpha-ketoglutaric semialdehyde dehydrogenase